MKTNKILLLLTVIATSLFMGCSQEENVQFDAVNGQTLANFIGSSATQPVIVEGTASTDVTIEVTTKSDVDRTIEVVPTAESTATSNQYTISNLVIPAGAYAGTFTVTGNYDNIPEGGNFELELQLSGLSGGAFVSSNDTFKITLFRFCPVQIGTYVIDMQDSYGDGWQTNGPGDGGNGIIVTLVDASGTETILEVGMCSPYNSAAGTFTNGANCSGVAASAGFNEAQGTIVIPDGTVDVTWVFPGDNYGEISFQITAPNGNLLFDSGAPGSLGQGDTVLPTFIYCL